MYRALKRCRKGSLICVTVLSVFVIMLPLLVMVNTVNQRDNLRFKREDAAIGNDVSEVRHLVFLKVHKCGSSTMMNLLMRFGLSRKLDIMVPINNTNVFSQYDYLRPHQFLHYTPNDKYDLLTCHVFYNKSLMSPYFPSDTKYVGIVRHPFEQFKSSFSFYRHRRYLKRVPGPNPLATFLGDPLKYDVVKSMTNNRMALDFGFPVTQLGNATRMREYVEQLVKELDFVMVVEYFDESLLILKRMFGWTMMDILYMSQKSEGRAVHYPTTQLDEMRHKSWAAMDYILYERFHQMFLEKLQQQDSSFNEELLTSKEIRSKVLEFCTETDDSLIHIASTKWNEEFSVDRETCEVMIMPAIPLIDMVRERMVQDK